MHNPGRSQSGIHMRRDRHGSGWPGPPVGHGDFSKDAGDSGSFNSTTCTLPSTGVNSCAVTYTPSTKGDGLHGITATYSGDATFLGNSAARTSSSISATRSRLWSATRRHSRSIRPWHARQTVTDDDPAGASLNPTGTITFTKDGVQLCGEYLHTHAGPGNNQSVALSGLDLHLVDTGSVRGRRYV